MLAYLLCDEKLIHELGSNCIDLSIKLNKEILENLKKQAEQLKNEPSKKNTISDSSALNGRYWPLCSFWEKG